MKRILFSFFLLLGIGALSYAQDSIIGSWLMQIDENESQDVKEQKVSADMQMSVSNFITFSEAMYLQRMEAVVKVAVTGKEENEGKNLDMTMKVKASMPGTWTLVGGELTLVPDPDAKPEISVETENFPGIIKGMIAGSLKKELRNDLKSKDFYQVVSVTKEQMILKERPDPAAKKKVEVDPEEMVFRRL